VFLMRQYFMTIPTDLDEAAAIDGAGPFRTLISVVLPQAWPVIVAVAVFHLVTRGTILRATHLTRPARSTCRRWRSAYSGSTASTTGAGLIQAGPLMTLVIPVIAFLLTPALLHARDRHHRRREVTSPRLAAAGDARRLR
jgi:multiple sugar transport system permease protein